MTSPTTTTIFEDGLSSAIESLAPLFVPCDRRCLNPGMRWNGTQSVSWSVELDMVLYNMGFRPQTLQIERSSLEQELGRCLRATSAALLLRMMCAYTIPSISVAKAYFESKCGGFR